MEVEIGNAKVGRRELDIGLDFFASLLAICVWLRLQLSPFVLDFTNSALPKVRAIST